MTSSSLVDRQSWASKGDQELNIWRSLRIQQGESQSLFPQVCCWFVAWGDARAQGKGGGFAFCFHCLTLEHYLASHYKGRKRVPQTSVSLDCLKLFRTSSFIYSNSVSVRRDHACSLCLTLMGLNEWSREPQASVLAPSPCILPCLTASVSILSKAREFSIPRKVKNTSIFFMTRRRVYITLGLTTECFLC